MSDMRVVSSTNKVECKSADVGNQQSANSQDAFASIMADATQRNGSRLPQSSADAAAADGPAADASAANGVAKNAKGNGTDKKDNDGVSNDQNVNDAHDVKEAKDSKESKDAKDAKDVEDVEDAKDAKDIKNIKDVKDIKDAKDAKDADELRKTKSDKRDDSSVVSPSAAALLQSLAPQVRDNKSEPSRLTSSVRAGASVISADSNELSAGGRSTAVDAKAKATLTGGDLKASDALGSAAAQFDTNLRAALEHTSAVGDKLAVGASSTPHSELPQLSAALAALSSAAPTTNAAPATQVSVLSPVLSPAFADDFSQRILVLANQHVQSAEISVNPPDLGPVTVKINMHGTEASLNFTAANATTRAALQDAMPRLQAMFETSGLKLTNTSVGGDQGRNAPDSRRGNRSNAGPGAIGAVTGAGATASALPAAATGARGLRLVDTFV